VAWLLKLSFSVCLLLSIILYVLNIISFHEARCLNVTDNVQTGHVLLSGVLASKVEYKRSALEGETSRRLVHSVSTATLPVFQFKNVTSLQLVDSCLPAGAVVTRVHQWFLS
jgi:hypothetical protein